MSFHGDFVRPAISLPPKSVISFVLTEEVPNCPDAGNVCRLDNTRDLFSTDLNNLCGCSFGTRIAH